MRRPHPMLHSFLLRALGGSIFAPRPVPPEINERFMCCGTGPVVSIPCGRPLHR